VQIVEEAREVLCTLGITITEPVALDMLAGFGARVDRDKQMVVLTQAMIDKALGTVPSSFSLYDIEGKQTHDFSGYNVHFTPASSSLNVLDPISGESRKGTTEDYITYTKVVSQLPHIASMSTAFVCSDTADEISDSYRLFLSLLYGTKPVISGTFENKSFPVMKDMQIVVRGSAEALKEKPLAVYTCCPTSPLKWSKTAVKDILDCGKAGIPVELVSVPLSGFIAPVTLVGTLVEHTAETLAGIVISQLANPGAPLLYGGAPAFFDIRYETTPMSALEAQMICCAYNEIGKHLGIPTQAFTGLSDSKFPDAQAGLEATMGAVLATLSGINNIAGPGVLDYVNTFSIEKLVLDNELCGMMLRMAKGIAPNDDFPSIPIFQELLKDKHLLISKHTRRNLRSEHYFPGPVIDRAGRQRWQEEGALSLMERARKQVEELSGSYEPNCLSAHAREELTRLMEHQARSFGMESLPGRN